MTDAWSSPAGHTIDEEVERWKDADPDFRVEWDRLQLYREAADMVVVLRTRHGISQEELARRVGTSKSAIARLESGRHKPSMETLRRIAEAFGGRLVISFDIRPVTPDQHPTATAV
jgi:DNA-binding XRE family transcriptional regulator